MSSELDRSVRALVSRSNPELICSTHVRTLRSPSLSQHSDTMEREAQRQKAAKDKTANSASRSRSPPPAKSSSLWKYAGGAAAVVTAGLLLRGLLKGTAPSPTSRYSVYKGQGFQHVHDKPPSYHQRATQFQHDHHQQFGGGGHHQSQHHSHPHGTHAPHRHEEVRWTKATRDYLKYSDFLEAERAHYASRSRAAAEGSADAPSYAPFREFDYDAEFETSKHQARAAFVQQKFMHLKRGRRNVRKYESWGGIGSREEQALRDAWEAEDHSAFSAVQQQMMTTPRFMQARALLFEETANFSAAAAPASAAAAASSAASAAASASSASSSSSSASFGRPLNANPGNPSMSPFSGGVSGAAAASLPPLTVDAVRSAYFARAKLCHPDVEGGNRERFEKLTDAYDLLCATLEPLEKRRKDPN